MSKIKSKNLSLTKIETKLTWKKLVLKSSKLKQIKKLEGWLNENNYLIDNNITTEPQASGLYYIETLEGTGNAPTNGQQVAVHYTGKLLDGSVFDSSIGKLPFTFPLGYGYVIAGWDEGIALMKKGGKATLIIPSSLGYGSSGSGSTIPPYSNLVFDVELVDIGM